MSRSDSRTVGLGLVCLGGIGARSANSCQTTSTTPLTSCGTMGVMILTAKRTARLVMVASLLSALFAVLNPGTAAACSCFELEPGSERDADAVFVARADTAAPRPTVERSGSFAWQRSVEVTFDVEQVFKGSVHRRQRIILPGGTGATCAVEINSARVLIFGHRPDDDSFAVKQPSGVYASGLCSMQPVEFVKFDLRELGPHGPPMPGSGPSARSPRGGDRLWGQGPVIGASALLTLVAVGGWVLVRRRRFQD